MKMTACLLALAAGGALASSALGQGVPAGLEPITAVAPNAYRLNADGTVTQVQRGNYGQRLVQTVYNADLNAAANYICPSFNAYDDARFTPLGGNDYPLTGIAFGIAVPSTTTDTAATIRFTFYDNAANAVAPPFPGTAQIGQPVVLNLPAGVVAAPATGGVIYDLEGVLPRVFSDDDRVGVLMEVLNAAGTGPHPSLRPVITGGPVNITVGASYTGCYIDNAGADGVLEGPYTAGTPAGLTLNMALTADLPATPPAGAVDLGTLTACTPVVRSLNVAAGEVKWFKITVPAAGVDAADAEALTIDTETAGSAADTVVAIYDGRGNLFDLDDDDGSGNLSQLTYGIGRWNGPGDGLPYDGRNGDLPAGVYYIAVTTFGAGLFFDEGFSITPGASEAATYDFNVNYYSESCLPSLSPPTADVDLGTILSPSAFPAALDMSVPVRWYKFNVCTEIADPAKYLDFDFSPSTGDLAAVIFDANGNEVAFSDDADLDANDGLDYFLPQFSFGNIGPRVGGGQGIGSDPLAGQDGTLPPGDYYMAVGGYPYALLPEAASTTHGRFYFFATATGATDSAWPFITTDVTQEDCDPVSTCPPCAADYDQDGGVTGSDLGAFFADFEQGLPCADVDQDGGVTGGDLGVFFAAFEAGGC